jgi:RHS repeat-associated protein
MMDQLAYTYAGNQLTAVVDNAGSSVTGGFTDGNIGSTDYLYDVNGNMTVDKNKGLSATGSIKYNVMNLPIEVNKGSEKVKYFYDARGHKLSQEVYNASSTLVKVTDYIGELILEGANTTTALKMIQHAEGRILPDGANWEYQYHLKDHLGNVRLSFTTKAQASTTVTTNFEAATNANFSNYTNTDFDLVDHTDASGTTYTKTQVLNGGVNGRVGLAKTYAVMPGDVITASAYVKYMNLGSTSNANGLVNSLANAFGVSSVSTGEQLKVYNALNSYSGLVTGGEHTGDDDAAPKLFVTILFFDKNHTLVDAAWDQVSSIGAQTSPTIKQPPHDLISVTAKAPDAGYAYVFLSNEHFTFVDAYFDDASFTHTPSQVISVSDYYPFGLAYNAQERTPYEQRFGYNGKELQDELSLNWYDYGARMYMSELGRWGAVDPMAEKYRRWSPYNYCVDNPVRFIDPDGMVVHEGAAAAGAFMQLRAKARSKARGGPTAKEAAAMAAHVYGNLTDEVLQGGWKVSNRNFEVPLNDGNTGLNSQIYQREKNGKMEYVYATAGTADLTKDVEADVAQPVGASDQVKQSISNAEKISLILRKSGESLTFVGHSLGGAEAAANAYATGRNAITFNASGVGRATMEENSNSTVNAYIMRTDPLNLLQNTHYVLGGWLMPDVNGNRIELTPVDFISRINGHSINNVLKSFGIDSSLYEKPTAPAMDGAIPFYEQAVFFGH